MKRIVSILIVCLSVLSAWCQSKDYCDVVDACCLAQKSMSHGKGSQTELREAFTKLNAAKWSPLIMQVKEGKGEANMKNHLVFSPKFLNELIKGHKVYKMAKEYAEQQAAEQRGGEVKLYTKCVKGGETVTYSVRHVAGKVNLSTVAETNGRFTMTVRLKDQNGKISDPYKSTSDEFNGSPYCKLENINVTGLSTLYITLENKSKEDKSVAIIME